MAVSEQGSKAKLEIVKELIAESQSSFFPNHLRAAEPNRIPHPGSVPTRVSGVLMQTSSPGHPSPTPTSRGSWSEWDKGRPGQLVGVNTSAALVGPKAGRGMGSGSASRE